MELRDLLFGLNELDGIGWKSIDKIIRAGYLSDDAFSRRAEEWREIGLNDKICRHLDSTFSPQWIEQRYNLMKKSGAAMLTILDKNYPPLLKETAQPPWILYYRGQLELLTRPAVAMVGTRVPTAYGRKIGGLLAEELGEAGFTVVSGLARGIDSICHEAALPLKGGTIAVMATGLEKAYPPENRELMQAIAEKGLVVTEYPIGTKSHPGLFPQRNRIIAGLTLGTVVVEADIRSGSLITADAALEAGRDVFAVPGPITSPKSRGALELIKQGAKLVTGSMDIMEEYASLWPSGGLEMADSGEQLPVSHTCPEEKSLTREESQLYHILQQGPFSLDELLVQSRWDFGLLHSVLLSLIIKKAVAQLPGAIYKVI